MGSVNLGRWGQGRTTRKDSPHKKRRCHTPKTLDTVYTAHKTDQNPTFPHRAFPAPPKTAPSHLSSKQDASPHVSPPSSQVSSPSSHVSSPSPLVSPPLRSPTFLSGLLTSSGLLTVCSRVVCWAGSRAPVRVDAAPSRPEAGTPAGPQETERGRQGRRRAAPEAPEAEAQLRSGAQKASPAHLLSASPDGSRAAGLRSAVRRLKGAQLTGRLGSGGCPSAPCGGGARAHPLRPPLPGAGLLPALHGGKSKRSRADDPTGVLSQKIAKAQLIANYSK